MATVQVFKALSITAPALLALLLTAPAFAATPERQINEEQANAELARQLYQQVWFSDHPDVVDQLFATEYVIHDDGNGEGFDLERLCLVVYERLENSHIVMRI